ncbi:hypothetical protein COV19_01740 [Candidatus Woesearchaeota archaeon CG10_big_fil_rev_8_21_14_0_10_44_13]|nr:MAG: hypothetical protein COV19_01740 [Candidatus Woesearchaeota archaeon CG10_big_fil_rev_8_21_14_0_10_44_13]
MVFRIYAPSKNPKESFITISVIVFAGILGSMFISVYFAIVALLFWVQYTAILSYVQFSKRRRYEITSFTTFILNPHFRFFIFFFIAVLGIASIFYMAPWIAYAALAAWWLFSLNFYRHYAKFK